MSTRRAATAFAVVLTGLSAGFFFTYEASITVGLTRVDDVTYVTTVQALNATVRNAAFGIVFFGSLPAIVVALATSWRSDPIRRAPLAIALVSYVACVVITGTQHVPLNEELALVGPVTTESAAAARGAFEERWNLLNLVRTFAAVGAFVAMALAAVSRSAPDRPGDERRPTDAAAA